MSHPRRAHGSEAGPRYPAGHGGLAAVPSDEEDLGPTGEHAPLGLLELSGSDLEPERGGGDGLETLPTPVTEAEPPPRPRRPSQAVLAPPSPEPARPRRPSESVLPPPPPSLHSAGPPDPLDRTMPPRPRMPEDLAPLPSEETSLEEAELEPIESAPTRVEREEDIIAAHDGVAPIGGPRLLIIGGNNRGKEFPLKLGDNSIGRGMDNDVVLADIAVSRKHTLVCFEDNQYVVRDLGSGNGTLLNSKRVDSTPLQDGDQLELGNTLLRFVSPVTQQPLASMSTVITPREALEGGSSSAAAIKTLDIPGRRDRTAATSVGGATRFRKRLLIFGSVGVIALLGLMIGVKAILVSRQKQQVQTSSVKKPDEVLAEAFREGVSEFHNRNWEKAREHFLKVLALAPNQGHVRQYVDRAGAEILARDALAKARTQLDARNFPAARQELAKIKSPTKEPSVYQKDAEALAQKLEGLQVKGLLDQARSLKEKGELASALDKVREAQGIAPANPEARALATEISDAQSGTRKPGKPDRPIALKPDRPTKPDPVRPPSKGTKHAAKPEKPDRPGKVEKPIKVTPSGQGKAALASYKKRQWAEAYQAMNAFAGSQPAKKQKAAKALAKAIYDVGQNWSRGEKSGNNPSAALSYYRIALAADAKIEKGSHQKALKELIVKSARAAAASLLAKKNFRGAFQAVQIGQQAGGNDPGLQKVIAALEVRAQELFNRGYTIHKSNLGQARKLWQEVLQMVPKTSPIYQKAYGWLNSGGRGSQDEDED